MGSSRGWPCLGGSVCVGRPHPGEDEGGEPSLWKGAPSWAPGAPLPGTQLLSGRACPAGRVPLSSLELDPSTPPPPTFAVASPALLKIRAGQSTSRDQERERAASALGEEGGARWAPYRGASAGTMASGSAARQGCSEGLAELNGRVQHTRMCACTPTRAHTCTHAYRCAEHTYVQCSAHACSYAHTQNRHTRTHAQNTRTHTEHACLHAHTCIL